MSIPRGCDVLSVKIFHDSPIFQPVLGRVREPEEAAGTGPGREPTGRLGPPRRPRRVNAYTEKTGSSWAVEAIVVRPGFRFFGQRSGPPGGASWTATLRPEPPAVRTVRGGVLGPPAVGRGPAEHAPSRPRRSPA